MLFCIHGAVAQDTTAHNGHKFTNLKLEIRADFDVQHQFGVTGRPATWDTTDYGFNGKYFNPIFSGTEKGICKIGIGFFVWRKR